MKSIFNNITIKSIALLMVVVIGMSIANRTFFLHIHKLNDGTIIQHAHPYNKSNDSEPHKSHNHSHADFLFFKNLKLIVLVVFLIPSLVLFFREIKILFSLKLTIRNTQICININKGRAPPIS